MCKSQKMSQNKIFAHVNITHKTVNEDEEICSNNRKEKSFAHHLCLQKSLEKNMAQNMRFVK